MYHFLYTCALILSIIINKYIYEELNTSLTTSSITMTIMRIFMKH